MNLNRLYRIIFLKIRKEKCDFAKNIKINLRNFECFI